jgi:LacI family transcriptional regulator
MSADTVPERATITHVAKYLGVSKSTVSRAFNRPGMLLPETVARVRDAAHELGYTPSKTAMSLSTGLYTSIAVVVPDIANPFFPRLIRAAQSRANERGMLCLLGDTDESETREATLLTELASDVHGFVLMSSRLPDEKLRELASKHNIVLINRDISGIRRVLLDTTAGMNAAMERLLSLGHRRFVYIGGPDRSWSNSQRLLAVQAFAERPGVSMTIEQATPATFEGGAEAAARTIGSKPTAFLCFDDVVAEGAVAALSTVGLRVPEDVSVVGCDDTLAAMVHPQMATIRLDYVAAGRAAIDMVLEPPTGRIPREDEGDGYLVLAGQFVEGATLAPAV